MKLEYAWSGEIGRMTVWCLLLLRLHQVRNIASFKYLLPSMKCNPQYLTNFQVPNYTAMVNRGSRDERKCCLITFSSPKIEQGEFCLWNECVTTTSRAPFFYLILSIVSVAYKQNTKATWYPFISLWSKSACLIMIKNMKDVLFIYLFFVVYQIKI